MPATAFCFERAATRRLLLHSFSNDTDAGHACCCILSNTMMYFLIQIINVSNKFDVRCIILCSLLACFSQFFLSIITPLINRSFSQSSSLSLRITVSSFLFLSLRTIVPPYCSSLFISSSFRVFFLILPLFFIFDPFSSLLTL